MIEALRDLVCGLVEAEHGAAISQGFATWLRSVEPTRANLALMLVEMALRRTPIGPSGHHRYVLTGFGPDGEPIIVVRAAQ